MTHERKRASALDRRRFLRHTWHGVGASLSLALLPAADLFARPRVGADPFTLGVASGDPSPDGIVLWTRLAPVPADPLSLGKRTIPVGWRVASDPQMRHVVARGVSRGAAELAHSVHVEVQGLRPSRDYFYQFDARDEESPIGHFRTTPPPGALAAGLDFAFVTCQDWPSGFYTAYRDMLRHDLDLVLHLGDYTYEYAIDGLTRRGIPVPEGFEAETVDLRTYRLRHTLCKLDTDLQAAHAKFPFAVIWDDHEVQNDYSGLSPEFGVPSPAFTARRAAAYQAYYEHMPIRLRVARSPDAVAAHLPSAAVRAARSVRHAGRSAVPHGQPVWRRRVAAVQCGADRRLHDARPGSGAVALARPGTLRRALECDRPAAADGRARAHAARVSGRVGTGTTRGTVTPWPDAACWKRSSAPAQGTRCS